MITPADLLDYSVQEVLSAELHARPEAVARRAVSASYYAVFHALTRAGALLFMGDEASRERLARSFDHSSLGSAARDIERQQSPLPDARLIALAAALRRLREARERADYDLATTITWDDADELLGEALSAFDLIHQLKSHPEMAHFLLAPLIQRRKRG